MFILYITFIQDVILHFEKQTILSLHPNVVLAKFVQHQIADTLMCT